MPKSTFAQRLNEIMKIRNKRQADITADTGIPKSALSQYCSGKFEAKQDRIYILANYFKVSEAWLMGCDVPMEKEAEQPLGNLQVLPNDKVYMIPVFDSVSAGFGSYACSDIKEYFPMYIDNPADAPDMLCLTVQGDSMYPKIEEGDMVAVRKQSSVDSGSVAVLLIDGEEGVVKKVNYGADWIELISFNPMYPPRRFEGAEVQRLQVVGLVKKVIKNM